MAAERLQGSSRTRQAAAAEEVGLLPIRNSPEEAFSSPAAGTLCARQAEGTRRVGVEGSRSSRAGASDDWQPTCVAGDQENLGKGLVTGVMGGRKVAAVAEGRNQVPSDLVP